MIKLSASQLKTFCSSRAKRVGRYCLWIKDDQYSEDNLVLWSLFEHYYFNKEDNYKILDWRDIEDMEKLIESYDSLKHNAIWLEIPIWDTQVKVEWIINNVPFIWFIDNLHDWIPRDLKTSYYLNKQDSKKKNDRSWMTYREEYELQLRLYMSLLWSPIGKVAEVAKYKYKDHEKHEHQIITFEMTDEWKKKMEDKYYPIINEMVELHNKYSQI